MNFTPWAVRRFKNDFSSFSLSKRRRWLVYSPKNRAGKDRWLVVDRVTPSGNGVPFPNHVEGSVVCAVRSGKVLDTSFLLLSRCQGFD